MSYIEKNFICGIGKCKFETGSREGFRKHIKAHGIKTERIKFKGAGDKNGMHSNGIFRQLKKEGKIKITRVN